MGTSAFVTLLVGFALGLRHSTDSDHIVAVSTLVSETQGAHSAARIGALWGLGHLATLFAAGTALVLLRIKVPLRLAWSLELLVALVLIALGVRTVRNCFAGRYHFHMHEHGARTHAHLHFHSHGDARHEHAAHTGAVVNSFGERMRRGRPLLVGMVHGLAGTAGLALLVLGSIPSRALGIAYLLVFGTGALAGMAAFSAVLSVPLSQASARLAWLRAIRLTAGAASCVLGAVLAYRAFLPGSFPS